MGSIVQPYVPAVIASRIQEALACGLIGVILASCVYGITVLQAYIYYKNSHRDSVYMRSFVAFLFILDTASLALAIQTIYEYVVIDFGNPLLLINMPPAMALENGATVVIGTLTQCFLAYRLWEFSKKNITLVCTIVILSFCAFGSGMVVSVQLYTRHLDIIFEAWSIEGQTLSGLAHGSSAVCDIVIAVALCYYLHTKRTEFQRTNSIIDQLIIYAVNRAGLTATCQAGEMITAIAFPQHYLYLPFATLSGKLYFNTLIATLNARSSLRKQDENILEVDTLFYRTDASARHGSSSGTATQPSENVSDGNISAFVLDISLTPYKTEGEVDIESAEGHAV